MREEQRSMIAKTRGVRPRTWVVLVAALLAETTLSGCFVNDKPLRTDLRPDVSVPARSAILMFIDGVGNEAFDQRLAAGDLPNIKKYILDRGLRYRRTVTCMPSITYAATATMLTGLQPGMHGIVGNCWFDPYTMQYQNYKYIKTYRVAQDDMFGRTIFEILHDQLTFSIQVAMRQGVTREIDNWATSGISWYFGQYTDVDKLTAMRFDLIAKTANQTGRWPTFVLAYFPACDKMGHDFGVESKQYAEAIRNTDEQIGRICRGLERAGVLDKTLIALVTDHGQAPMRYSDCTDVVEDYLQKQFGVRATDDRYDKPEYEARYAYYDRSDVVAVPDATRLLGLHLRGAGLHWYDRARDVRHLELQTRNGRIRAEELAEDLAAKPYSRFVAVRAGEDTVLLVSRRGKALVHRHETTSEGAQDERISYRIVQGSDPLSLGLPALAGSGKGSPSAEAVMSVDQWLAATIDSENPGVVSQVVGYFDSTRSGDIVVFAEPGYGFGLNHSGHGSTTPQEMRIPLVFAGPGVRRGVTNQPARLHSLMPTIVTYLGFGDRLRAAPVPEGPVLSLQAQVTDTQEGSVQTRFPQ
jgi:arylsulfatase A-like enzyme